MSKQDQINDLKSRVHKIEQALRYPTLAHEEGFGGLRNEFRNLQTQLDDLEPCDTKEEELDLLLAHLGLKIEDGKRIVKVTKKGKK